jgi:hypothetical protein
MPRLRRKLLVKGKKPIWGLVTRRPYDDASSGLTSGGIELSGVIATDLAAAFLLRVSLARFAASLRFLAVSAAFAFLVAAAFTAA